MRCGEPLGAAPAPRAAPGGSAADSATPSDDASAAAAGARDAAGVTADAILVLGSHDMRVAERGAELWLEGRAPYLVLSGGLGNFTKGVFSRPEARVMADVARAAGVPDDRIVVEDASTNTGDNVDKTRALLAASSTAALRSARRFLLVQKPYMERRAVATFGVRWPEAEVVAVTSPCRDAGLEGYATDDIPAERVASIMVGDLQRIVVYPSRGFQLPQEVPEEVEAAWYTLVRAGFTSHLLGDMPPVLRAEAEA